MCLIVYVGLLWWDGRSVCEQIASLSLSQNGVFCSTCFPSIHELCNAIVGYCMTNCSTCVGYLFQLRVQIARHFRVEGDI